MKDKNNFFQGLFWQFIVCDNPTQSPALFQSIFRFCTFLPKFSNILPFFHIFCHFSEKAHAYPYLLEQALFLLSRTLLFFLKQKYILFLATQFFKIPKHLIASVFFLLRQILKNMIYLGKSLNICQLLRQISNAVSLFRQLLYN